MKPFGRSNWIPNAVFEAVYVMPAWQKAAIFLAAWLVPVAAFWFFFLSGTLDELTHLTQRIPQLKREIARLEAKARTLPQLQAELKGLQEIFNKATKLLPQSEDIPGILSQISSLGNEAHLRFSSFRPGGERRKGFYAAIPVSITVTGPFHNTMTFFDQVAHMPRIVHITNVSMGGARQGGKIWSQITGEGGAGGGGPKGSGANKAGGTSRPGPAGKGGVERGGSWIITTVCTAETYRFLTPKERGKGGKGR